MAQNKTENVKRLQGQKEVGEKTKRGGGGGGIQDNNRCYWCEVRKSKHADGLQDSTPIADFK